MYKYTGTFALLEKLGFQTNSAKTYYFLPTHNIKDRFHNPISIDIKTKIIEFNYLEDLQIIKDYIEEIV